MNHDERFYVTFEIQEGSRVPTGGWPRVEMVAQKWEENRRGERRFVDERRIWCYFDIDPEKGQP